MAKRTNFKSRNAGMTEWIKENNNGDLVMKEEDAEKLLTIAFDTDVVNAGMTEWIKEKKLSI